MVYNQQFHGTIVLMVFDFQGFCIYTVINIQYHRYTKPSLIISCSKVSERRFLVYHQYTRIMPCKDGDLHTKHSKTRSRGTTRSSGCIAFKASCILISEHLLGLFAWKQGCKSRYIYTYAQHLCEGIQVYYKFQGKL